MHSTQPVTIWRIELDHPPEILDSLHTLLSPAEQGRAARFVYPRDRDRYIAAHGAVRIIIGQALNTTPESLDFRAGPQGKPYLAGHPLHFNLSHAGTLALLAISPDCRLGIDLEPIRDMPDALSLAAQFHPAEQASLRLSHPSPRAFFECWTRKEAFVKATGEGLYRPLESFAVTFHPDPKPKVDIPGWHLLDIPIADYCAALAVEAQTLDPPSLQLKTWNRELSANS